MLRTILELIAVGATIALVFNEEHVAAWEQKIFKKIKEMLS